MAWAILEDSPYTISDGKVLFEADKLGKYAIAKTASTYKGMEKLSVQCPYICSGGAQVQIGNDIYMFGSKYGNNTGLPYSYKFNVITKEYTRLADQPHSTSPTLVSDGSRIWTLGNYTGTNTSASGNTYCYEYSIENDTWTKCGFNSLSYWTYAGAFYYDGYIYLFGGSTNTVSPTYNYDIMKINVETEESVKIGELPHVSCAGDWKQIGDKFYTISRRTDCYSLVFDPATDTLTYSYPTTNLPNYEQYAGGSGHTLIIDNYIYHLGRWIYRMPISNLYTGTYNWEYIGSTADSSMPNGMYGGGIGWNGSRELYLCCPQYGASAYKYTYKFTFE